MDFAIIAAGEGSRLVQEGVRLPKPLVEINGVPMIERLASIFNSCGAEKIAVIVNEQMTEVREFLEKLSSKLPIETTVKTTPSSMHSFYEVSQLLSSDKFILTTVDTIFRADDFKKYVDAFAADSLYDGFMAVTPFIDDEKPLYVAVDDNMKITGFFDSPTPETRFVSGGIYGLTPPALKILGESMDAGITRMRNYQRKLVDSGLKLKALPIDKIIDVDHQSDIAKAEQFLKNG